MTNLATNTTSSVVAQTQRRTNAASSLGSDFEQFQGLGWLRTSLNDETSRMNLPKDIRSSVSPIISALRWGALLYAMFHASTQANSGNVNIVITLSICMFVTIWRTFLPLRLAWKDRVDRLAPIIDTALLGVGMGASEGFANPFIFCFAIAACVSAFGWGLISGLSAIGAGTVAMLMACIATGSNLNILSIDGGAILAATLVGVLLTSLARDGLISRQRQQLALTGRVDMLSETNELLSMLNKVARTLPESMDMSQAVTATERELHQQFDATTIGLVIKDEAMSRWLPMIHRGCDFKDSTATEDLAPALQHALESPTTVLSNNLTVPYLNPQSQSAMYCSLRTRGKVIGLLAVESDQANHYDERAIRILDGLAGALALTIDNVRSFGRLRTIGADQERTRIARDLHDRLGQWLTYISLELERIMGESQEVEALSALYGDVQTAIEELRETLRQLRTNVSDEQPLAQLGQTMIARFSERTGIEATFRATNPSESMRLNIENEMLRILQEALNNVEKHSQATRVDVAWSVDNGESVLLVRDNGRGFDTSGAVRDTSYGLLGMRERADVIGAELRIVSEPNIGTTIQVHAKNELSI